jgi:hypothetical protein
VAEPVVELWGFPDPDIEAVRAVVERTLGVVLELRESASIGPYYHAAFCGAHADLVLRPNLDASFDPETDDPDESLEEPDFPDFGSLLYVEWTTNGHTCRQSVDALSSEAQLLVVE